MSELMNQEKYPNLIRLWIRRISPQAWTAFFSALIFGVFCHGPVLFNKISYQDDIYNLFGFGATVTSGRWMLHILAWLETLLYGNGNTSLPLFNGLISILCVGAVSGLLAELLKIRKRIFCALLGGLLSAFPVLTALFAYMFTSHPYLIGLLMTVVSAVLICRGTPWWAKCIAAVLGGASVGIYQAFFPVLPAILLIYDLMILGDEKEKPWRFLRRAGMQALCVLGALAFYFAANRFFLAKFQVELSSYMGINQMGALSVTEYLGRCGRAYGEFFSPTKGIATDMYPGTLRVLYGMMLAADGLLAAWYVSRIWRQNRAKALLSVLLLAAFPLACNLIFVMSGEVHSLMVYGQAMQMVMLVWLLDQADARNGALSKQQDVQRGEPMNPEGLRRKTRPERSGTGGAWLRRAVSLAGALMLAVTGLMYARYDQQAYLKDTFRQQQAFSYYTTLITQIKLLKGFRPDMELCVLGAWYTDDPTIYNLDELDFIHLNTYDGTSRDFMYMTREYFLENWLGFRVRWYGGTELYSLPEVKAMPVYPADGSIRIIQDTVVVKLQQMDGGA